MLLALLAACTGEAPAPSKDGVHVETGETAADSVAASWPITVRVTLDGDPVADTLVMQGGGVLRWTTDADGLAAVEVDPAVVGDLYVVAAHADARIDGVEVEGPTDDVLEIPLVRFDPSDNPDYVFADPGPEEHEGTTTAQCSHCHVTIHHEWYDSPHRQAASNPAVHDVYAGTAATFSTEALCAASGGTWGQGIEPGTGASVERCLLGEGVRAQTDGVGACADCHAPGIDGELGGRDLLEATGIAYDAGVHCDVCHHVESVDMAQEPGVAGRLHIVRPSEDAENPGVGEWDPLTFGPLADVLNPRMGSVHREHFHEPEICGGCHEQYQEVLVADGAADLSRWPDGRLPIHTTYSEWEAGPMNPAAPCQSCHMPPKPDVGNSADLYNEFENVLIGVSAGWERAPGEVRAHAWWGPRQRESGMLEAAASVHVEKTVADGVLAARVTVRNVGPGHAIPTGEPMRSLVLRVEATCDGTPLAATGGDAIPDFGGWLDRKDGGEDWSTWPGAEVGDVVRVVRRTGAFHDYAGFGPFGDGTFPAAEKGMPIEEVVGEATVVAVEGDVVTLDRALPEGDVAYRGEAASLPIDGDEALAVAGAPGFAFARVLVGADGARMVPHFVAVDVASDNRLLPQESWTSTHTFAATCADPEVHAVLVHRAYPLDLARERGWALTESVMTEASE
ncbi:MAG: hypothetical protein ACOZNI_00825 [Myxococcota bacterium]